MVHLAATRMVLAILLVIANAAGWVVPAKACSCAAVPVPSNHLSPMNAECEIAPASEKCRRPCCAGRSEAKECCRTVATSMPASGSANCPCVLCDCANPGEIPLSPASERSCPTESDSTLVAAPVPPAYLALPAAQNRGRFEPMTDVLHLDRITLLNRLTC
ncbi:MAG: hypothetical protein U0791_06025 [Gemmataceae bacterium]